MRDRQHQASYRLEEGKKVAVRYSEPVRSTSGGIAMIVGGNLVLAPSLGLLVIGGYVLGSSGEGTYLGKVLFPVGLLGAVAAHALIVPGILMIVNDQTAKNRSTEGSIPTLTLGPGSVSARVAF